MYITYCQLHYNLLEHPSPIGHGWEMRDGKCRAMCYTLPSLPKQLISCDYSAGSSHDSSSDEWVWRINRCMWRWTVINTQLHRNHLQFKLTTLYFSIIRWSILIYKYTIIYIYIYLYIIYLYITGQWESCNTCCIIIQFSTFEKVQMILYLFLTNKSRPI